MPALKPLENYLEEAKRRDLFSLLPPSPESSPQVEVVKKEEPPPPTPLEILRRKAEALKLVGTSLGEVPIAMIEDTVTRRTYFVKKGDFIEDIRIESITEGRAVLAYQGAHYDLF